MTDADTVSNLIIGIVSGGMLNTSVLVWLGLQYVKMSNRLAILETHISYLRQEVAYANGRAEPDDSKSLTEGVR